MDYHIGDKVRCLKYPGIFEVTRKHFGVNLYEIAKVHRFKHDQFLTNIHDGLYSEELEMVSESPMRSSCHDQGW